MKCCIRRQRRSGTLVRKENNGNHAAKGCFGLIYAAEDNINLRELTARRSVGALPLGGRYRVIDFILSNMVNSGIRNIGVLPRRNYQSMMDHLGSGKEWSLNRKSDGLFILPPFDNVEDNWKL